MNNLLKIFVAPGEVFASMKEKIESVPPLIALLLCVAVFTGVQPLFFSDEAIVEHTDEALAETFDLFDRIARSVVGEEVVEEIREEMEEASGGITVEEMASEIVVTTQTPEQLQVTRIVTAFTSPISALIWLGLGVILLSTYFNLAGNSRETGRAWSDWFGFTLWSMMPVALYYLLFLIATIFTGELDSQALSSASSVATGFAGQRLRGESHARDDLGNVDSNCRYASLD